LSPLKLFVDSGNSNHNPAMHPDRPSRISACLEAIHSAPIQCEMLEAPAASDEDLLRVHPPDYLKRLDAFGARGGGFLDPDTQAGPGSLAVAKRAAGACCSAVDAALDEQVRSFCLVRPPGHHALADKAMGFCLINNVAVGASHAIAKGASRVVVLDIDVHHGNGTQEIFWRDPNVFYVSLHQWPWYPWDWGAAGEIGGGKGEGANLNVPLASGSGDEDYLAAFDSIVAPAVRRYLPDMLLVSAGFDAHAADELSLQRVTASGFGAMANLIVDLADEVCEGRMMMTLEGGYNLPALSESVLATLRAM